MQVLSAYTTDSSLKRVTNVFPPSLCGQLLMYELDTVLADFILETLERTPCLYYCFTVHKR